ncbi:peptide ABC transporter substrate-binding protein [Vallitalea guaymasensis]|uniref:peptide ABC transporter substrate-binding protein n=1 Tax=Vallitalea guaymasensis TaxID=1185412 RepID=UPI000DE28A86|nr:peptide ABC transporter substrate-binding protein [Vallitalea guaymasensis]
MKKLSLIMLLILCFSLLSGCTKTTDKDAIENTQVNQQDEKEKVVEATPEFGGELKLLMRDPSTLNPLLNTDRTVDQVLKLVFDSLFELDDKEKPVPNLVDSYQLSDSGTTITITLKKNVLFHDGEELHSDDVIYTIETLKAAPEDSIYKNNVKNYKRASAVDQYTFKIYFDQPFAFSLYTMNFPIIPKHHYKSNEDNSMRPIGTGAYAFADFTTMKELNLTANENWYNGEVYVEKIKGIITRDKNNDSDAFNQSIVDIINPTKFDWQDYAETEGVSLTEYPTYYYTFLGFNFNNTLLNDKNIRKSIAYAIDRKDIIKNEFLDHAYITEYPIHPKSWLNESESITYEKDTDKSKELIAAAGYADANGEEQKPSLRLLVNSENPLRLRIANKIKESLENVGFIINIDLVDNVTYNQKIVNKDFDLLLGEWKLSVVPDFTFAFHSSQIENGSNFISYNNPDMDRVLETIFGSINDTDILSSTNEFKNLFADELPYFSLFFRTSAIISKDRVKGSLNPSIYNNYKGIKDLYISK